MYKLFVFSLTYITIGIIFSILYYFNILNIGTIKVLSNIIISTIFIYLGYKQNRTSRGYINGFINTLPILCVVLIMQIIFDYRIVDLLILVIYSICSAIGGMIRANKKTN